MAEMKLKEFLEKGLQSHIETILHDTKYTCKYTTVLGDCIEEYGEFVDVTDENTKDFWVVFTLVKEGTDNDIHATLSFNRELVNKDYVLHFDDIILNIEGKLHPDDMIEVVKLLKNVIDKLDKCVIKLN